jgi:hypothetical protein
MDAVFRQRADVLRAGRRARPLPEFLPWFSAPELSAMHWN